MGLNEDLTAEVQAIFKAAWTERDGDKVPEAEDLKLANEAVKLIGTVLYADLADSTKLVDASTASFAAEIYKTFLHCAAKIIKAEGGTITAYDGDRIMAVYIGSLKNTSAARSALKINRAMSHIVRPALKRQYPNSTYEPKHVVGIDTSSLYVARTGVRGANDLVWVGRAANYAAKLTTLPHSNPSYITADVYEQMLEAVKIYDGRQIWTALTWNTFDNSRIYGSTWHWPI